MPASLFCPVCGGANDAASIHCFACSHLFSPQSQPSSSVDGTLLQGRYKLGTCLGSGGYSLVYHARDLQAGGRSVAIKEISLQGLSATAAVDATDTYHREARMLSNLSHPQVPHLYEHFGDRDHWYLVLDYIEGQTLETYLATREWQGQPLSWEESLALILQLCPILEYLHSRQPPIIYRDLKPGNIMRTPKGALHLIDFGIARTYQPGLARDTQRLGSLGYAAPEQYGLAQTTPQADLYSLGALLHFLLSGQDPSQMGGALPPLHLDAQRGSADLEQFVERLLSPNLSERPATIHEVAMTLRSIRDKRLSQGVAPLQRLASPRSLRTQPAFGPSQQQQIQLPVSPGGATAPGALWRITRRNVLIGLGALTVAVGAREGILWLFTPYPAITYRGHKDVINAVVWSPDGKRIASASNDMTVQVWDAADGSHIFTYRGHLETVNTVAWSPDSKRIASGSSDTTVLVWDAVDGGHTFTYLKNVENITSVAWSPDGKRIASGSSDWTVQVWDAVDGGHIYTYRGHKDVVNVVAWSPDGKRIVSASSDTTVQVWDAVGGGHIFNYQGHTGIVRGVAWSPDGKWIASASKDMTVQVWDVVDGSYIYTYRGHKDVVNAVAWSPDGKQIASASAADVQVWDRASENRISTYEGAARTVVWSPDGKQIAFTCQDNTVQVWKTA